MAAVIFERLHICMSDMEPRSMMAAVTAALLSLSLRKDGYWRGWGERREKSATLFRMLNISAFHFIVSFHELPLFLGL